MRGRRWAHCIASWLALSPCACADVVIGQFSDTGTGTDADTGAPESTTSASSSSGDGAADGSGDTGDEIFVPPGCFSDDFEDGVIDDLLWNAWNEGDSKVQEVDGVVRFTPPTSGVVDTGLTTTFRYRFPFASGHARVHMSAPPLIDQPVALFLMVLNSTNGYSLNVGSGNVRMSLTEGEGPSYSETFPTDPYPTWLGIRAEGSLIYFETSDDGMDWTVVTSYEPQTPLEDAGVLIMTQTYGDIPTPADVLVDHLEVCID